MASSVGICLRVSITEVFSISPVNPSIPMERPPFRIKTVCGVVKGVPSFVLRLLLIHVNREACCNCFRFSNPKSKSWLPKFAYSTPSALNASTTGCPLYIPPNSVPPAKSPPKIVIVWGLLRRCACSTAATLPHPPLSPSF